MSLHADDAVALSAPRHEDAERRGRTGLCGLDGRGLGPGVELRLRHRGMASAAEAAAI